jgi:hypothetical protein
MALVEMVDGNPVFTSKVPFGYTDGLSMTTIRGGPQRYPPPPKNKIALLVWVNVFCVGLRNRFPLITKPCRRIPLVVWKTQSLFQPGKRKYAEMGRELDMRIHFR